MRALLQLGGVLAVTTCSFPFLLFQGTGSRILKARKITGRPSPFTGRFALADDPLDLFAPGGVAQVRLRGYHHQVLPMPQLHRELAEAGKPQIDSATGSPADAVPGASRADR